MGMANLKYNFYYVVTQSGRYRDPLLGHDPLFEDPWYIAFRGGSSQ